MIVDLRLLGFFIEGRKVESWLRVGLSVKLVALWFIELRLVIILGWLLIIRLRGIKIISLMLLAVSVEHIIVVIFLGIGVILIIVRGELLGLWSTRPWDVLFTSRLVTEAISVAIIADVVAELPLLGQASIVLNRLGLVASVDENRWRVLHLHISSEVLQDLLAGFRSRVDVAKLDVLFVITSGCLNTIPLFAKCMTARAGW